MNLTSKRARRAVIALCSTGLVAAGGWFGLSASAAGQTLSFLGATGNAATILNVDPGASSTNAAATFGIKVSGALAADPDPLRLSLLTAPTGGSLSYERVAGNGTPTAAAITPVAITTLGADATGGATSNLTVASSTGFVAGHWVSLAAATGANVEFAVIGSIPDATHVTLTSNVVNTHLSGLNLKDLGTVTASTAVAGVAVAASDVAVQVTSSAGFVIGHWAELRSATVGLTEFRRITSIPDGTHIGIAAASNIHAIGQVVTDLGVGTGIGTAAAIGDTSLIVPSSAGFAAGQRINVGGTTPEYVLVSAIPDSTHITLTDPLAAAHAVGASVVSVGTATATFAPVIATATRQVLGYNLSTNTDNIFVGATVPGTYTFTLFKDRNGNASYDSASDDTTPTFTLTVLDATAVLTPAFAPTVSAASSVDKPLAITASVTAGGVSTTDIRGSVSSIGALGTALQNVIKIGFAETVGTPLGGAQALAATTFDGTTFNRTSNATTGAGTVTVNVGAPTTVVVSRTVTVAVNNVTAVDLAPTEVSGTIAAQAGVQAQTATGVAAATSLTLTGTTSTNLSGHRLKISKTGETTEYVVPTQDTSGTTTPTLASALVYSHSGGSTITDVSSVAVKTGTAAVTYTATVLDSDTDKSGNVVYFTLGGTDVASLTTNGTTVNAATHVFSAITDAAGVASLTVTDGATTRVGYTVAATTNSITGDTLTTTYADAAGTMFVLTNTTASLYPAVGSTTVTLTGKLVDQFGAAFQPPVSASQQATVTVDANASTCGTYGAADVTGYGTLAAGLFSYTYTPAVAGTAGECDTFRFAYAGATSLDTALRWASTTAAGTVTLTTPNDAATGVNLSNHLAIAPGQGTGVTDFGNTTGQITGTVVDSGNAALAYKTVTLTGSEGVYFSTLATGAALTTTATAVTNTSGAFNGVYAFFTIPGAATITATVGAKSDVANLTTDDSSDPYTVMVNDAAGVPGSTLVVTGTVMDMFGKPVPSTYVDLGTGTSTIGSLASTKVQTNSAGTFSTTFTSGSNQSGTATLTAKLYASGSSTTLQTANLTPATIWTSTAAITGLPTGKYTDTGTITVAAVATTATGPASRVGAGSVTITGATTAGASVDIYAKPAGSAGAYVWVDTVVAGSTGAYSATETVTRSTTFVARVGTATSAAYTVTVAAAHPTPKPVVKHWSTVKVTAKALSKHRVMFSVTGKPAAKATVLIYRLVAGHWKLVSAGMSNAKGMAAITIKSTKGLKTFRVMYAPKGWIASGANVTLRVK